MHGCGFGKVILLGEHSVVYGRPALAAGIDRRLEATVARAAETSVVSDVSDSRLAEAVAEAARMSGLAGEGFTVEIRSELPPAAGLGSSAALGVALVRALAALAGENLPPETVCLRAFEIEKIFHGFPSGIDNTVATYGGLLRFQRDRPLRGLAPVKSIPLVVAIGREPRETGRVVRALRQRWEERPSVYEAWFDQIGALVAEAEAAIGRGDHVELGRRMNENHDVLARLGVSTAELDEMVRLAREQGALGAKLTGGGGGGAVICLHEGDRAALVAAFQRRGWRSFAAELAPMQAAASGDGHPDRIGPHEAAGGSERGSLDAPS